MSGRHTRCCVVGDHQYVIVGGHSYRLTGNQKRGELKPGRGEAADHVSRRCHSYEFVGSANAVNEFVTVEGYSPLIVLVCGR